jgi:hypothetical protein
MFINKKLSILARSLARCSLRAFSNQSELEKLSKKPRTVTDFIPEINKPRPTDGGIHSVERVIQTEQASQ